MNVHLLFFSMIGAWFVGMSTALVTQSKQPKTFARRSFFAMGPAAVAAVVSLPQLLVPQQAFAAYIDPTEAPPKVTMRVYMDVQIGDEKPERVVIGLFGELMPKTVDNFASLAGDGKYAGTTFYRVISGLSLQGGAIGDPIRGRTGKSAFGKEGAPFEPDNYTIKHSKAGIVSTVRGVGGLVDSRFFIQTSDDGGWADDRYAAFGIIVSEQIVDE
jgi:cyclophilin family peptidyl-prolyl cis-trans isomerase